MASAFLNGLKSLECYLNPIAEREASRGRWMFEDKVRQAAAFRIAALRSFKTSVPPLLRHNT